MQDHSHKFTPGYKINMLTFVAHGERVPRPDHYGNGRATVVLRCDCGATVTKDRYAWLGGRQQSCGCLGKSKPNHVTHGASGSPLWHRWMSMKARTTPGTVACSGNYIGVKRDPRWDTFEGFRDNQPTTGRPFSRGMELARFGDVGDYTPENTRWLTKSENTLEMLERRRLLLPDGRRAVDVARENGIPLGTWETRYYLKGVDLATAVTVRNMRSAA